MNSDITVIVPVYNREDMLPRCLDSIVDQSVPCMIHIVDDCSTDRTLDVAFQYQRTHASILVSRSDSNSGSPDWGINLGFRQCATKYVTWIASDDYYNSPDALLHMQQALEKRTAADYVYCDFAVQDPSSLAPRNFGRFKACDAKSYLTCFAERLVPEIPWNGMWRKAYLRQFDTPWSVFEWAKTSSDTLNGVKHFATNDLRVVHLPEKLITYTFHPGQATAGLISRVNSLESKLTYLFSVTDSNMLSEILKVANDRLEILKAGRELIAYHIRKFRSYLQFSDLSTREVYACNKILDDITNDRVLNKYTQMGLEGKSL